MPKGAMRRTASRKGCIIVFSVTYFRLEIKYKRKFVAMTHEEQISLFEALALNGAWSNAACTGYCLLAMQRAGLDEKTIEKVLHELHWAFDDTSVEQAEKIYCGGEE
jgi:hypothetical protein